MELRPGQQADKDRSKRKREFYVGHDMEEFKAVRAPEEEKVTIISMYLTGDAKENPDGAGQTA